MLPLDTTCPPFGVSFGSHRSFALTHHRTTTQTSRGKNTHFQCKAAEFTPSDLDGYGLCCLTPTRPSSVPCIQFLFVGSHFCYTLPSDTFSRYYALAFRYPSPPSGWKEDFHLPSMCSCPAHVNTTSKLVAWVKGSIGALRFFKVQNKSSWSCCLSSCSWFLM